MKTFYVNGQKIQADNLMVSYEQVVKSVYGDNNLQPSVIYKGAYRDGSGILSPGRSIRIKDGTKFAVMMTGNA